MWKDEGDDQGGHTRRPTTPRYSNEEKDQAVRLMLELRKELGTTQERWSGWKFNLMLRPAFAVVHCSRRGPAATAFPEFEGRDLPPFAIGVPTSIGRGVPYETRR